MVLKSVDSRDEIGSEAWGRGQKGGLALVLNAEPLTLHLKSITNTKQRGKLTKKRRSGIYENPPNNLHYK